MKKYYHEEICEGLYNDREGTAPRRETSAHVSLRKETKVICTSDGETQTDLGDELLYDGRVRGQ